MCDLHEWSWVLQFQAHKLLYKDKGVLFLRQHQILVVHAMERDLGVSSSIDRLLRCVKVHIRDSPRKSPFSISVLETHNLGRSCHAINRAPLKRSDSQVYMHVYIEDKKKEKNVLPHCPESHSYVSQCR